MLISSLMLLAVTNGIPVWSEPAYGNCPSIAIEDQTAGEWKKRDEDVVVSAKKYCKKHFPKHPCVKSVVKTENYNYEVICGGTK